MTTIITLIVSLLLLNAFNPKGMLPLDLLIAGACFLYWWYHRPHPRKKLWKKKRKPTIEDVWATIHSAQYTLDHSYDVIYGRQK